MEVRPAAHADHLRNSVIDSECLFSTLGGNLTSFIASPGIHGCAFTRLGDSAFIDSFAIIRIMISKSHPWDYVYIFAQNLG